MKKYAIGCLFLFAGIPAFSATTYTIEQLKQMFDSGTSPVTMTPKLIFSAHNLPTLDGCINWIKIKMEPYSGYPRKIEMDGSLGQYNVKLYTETERLTFDCIIAPNINGSVYSASYQ